MEWLNMMGSLSVRLWLAQATVMFFVVGGAALLAFGLSLIFNSSGTLRFVEYMNRWVSMRGASKSLEVPRDTRHAVLKYRYLFAVIFVTGGIYASYGLLLEFNAVAVIKLLGLEKMHPNAAGWLVDSLRWFLVAGNLAAIVAGIMLAFFPDRVAKLEAQAGRWISMRQATKGADDMKIKLDSWVAVYPRAIGAAIAVIGLVMVGIFGAVATRIW
jgi:hypothetical protein